MRHVHQFTNAPAVRGLSRWVSSIAVYSFVDGKFTVNAVNLSAFTRKATLSFEADELESTAMGNTWRTRIGGLKDGSVEFEMNQDFAASAVDVTLFALLGTVVAFTGKVTTAATSSTNPEYQGSVLISKYSPLDGSVGDLGTTSMQWPTSGAITRAVA